MQNIQDVLLENQLSIIHSLGDGHCLFYSFLSSWHSQFSDRPRLSLKNVFDKSRVEFYDNINFYRPFLDGSDSQAQQQLMRYVSTSHRDFNHSIADIYPAVLANAFGIDICIFDQSNLNSGAFSIHTFPSRCSTSQKPLYLHRINNDHYNGIRPSRNDSISALNGGFTANCSTSPVVPVVQLAPTASLQYSSDFLKSFKHITKINRPARKSLFSLRIWNPKAQNISETNLRPCQEEPQNIPVVITQRRKSPARKTAVASLREINLNGGASNGDGNHNVRLSTVNTQSIRNKTGDTVTHVVTNDIDICAITETWLKADDDAIRQECQPDGYTFTDSPRQSGRQGGGTGLLCRSPLTQSLVQSGDNKSFEFSEWLIKGSSAPLRVVVLYRPTYSENHKVPTSVFLDEFAEFIPSVILAKENLVLIGDFNIHVDDPTDSDANKFKALLAEFGLKQHVRVATHKAGHTLDLIVTRECDSLCISEPEVEYFVSDHAFVTCRLDLKTPTTVKKEITYRQYRSIDVDKFKSDIDRSVLSDVNDTCCNDADDLDALASQYNDTLRAILDEHAPIKTKVISKRPSVPWHNERIHELRKQRRKAEHLWCRHRGDPIKNVEYRETFQALRNECRAAVDDAKLNYYSDKVQQCAGDQKKLFALITSLKKPLQSEQYPSSTSLKGLADAFGEFFVTKIKNIRSKLEATDVEPLALPRAPINEEDKLHTFCPLSQEDVRKLIKKSPNKHCDSDPIPTWLLKECLDSLLPVLTLLVNKSLEMGHFPEEWKNALVTPLLKKLGLDLIYPNYRPVSNLPFISKLTEKASVNQITDHMEQRNPLPSHQSAYRPFHSTETALMKVQSDILMNMDNQRVTLLVMLDLSAAFDTIDHGILLETLKARVGIAGTALKWFESYLANRTQQVKIHGVSSEKVRLETGVPQGSCLGPVLFIIYVADLFRIIESHLPDAHGYADDHQVQMSFRPSPTSNQIVALNAMEACIADVRRWFITNWLMVNDIKTEFLILGSRQQLERVNISSIQVGEAQVAPVNSVRNLGVIFDSNMGMDQHVAKACRTAYYHLHNIRRIRNYLTEDATQTIIHAFITSQIDYCNSLMSGLPAQLIKKLQRVQNTAARLIYKMRKYDHISPALIALHWLPVKYRIQFKVLLMVYKGLHGMAPDYIASMLKKCTSTRYSLRSNYACVLMVPKFHCDTFGKRAFAVAGPMLWNSLPQTIRSCDDVDSFKRDLKTYLFTKFINECN